MIKHFKNGCMITSDDCGFYNIYSININCCDKTIECNDIGTCKIGTIWYNDAKKIFINTYNNLGYLDGNIIILAENGKLNKNILEDL